MSVAKKPWQIGMDRYLQKLEEIVSPDDQVIEVGYETSQSFLYILTEKALCAFGGFASIHSISVLTRKEIHHGWDTSMKSVAVGLSLFFAGEPERIREISFYLN